MEVRIGRQAELLTVMTLVVGLMQEESRRCCTLSVMIAARGIQVIMFADCYWKHTHRYYSLCRLTEGLLPLPGGLFFAYQQDF